MVSKRNSSIISFFALCTVLTAVYWNHFDNGFHFDDSHTIENNSYISEIGNIPLFFVDPRSESSLPENQTYRPVITSLNAIDYWIAGGLDSRVFHIHIFLEFLVLLGVLFAVLIRLFEASSGQKHYYLALFGTAFFAFHTATAETINYIIARSDGFSTLMVLTGMLVFTSSSGWKRQLALIPFVIGCLAKPTTLMLAPILVLYCLLIERPSLFVLSERPALGSSLKRTFVHTSSFLLVGAGMYVFTRSMYPDTWIPGGGSTLYYLNTQPYVILIYLKTFVLPTGLTADTDLDIIRELFAPRVIFGLFVIGLLFLIAFFTALRRITLPISFGILWFFVTLAPTSSVIPLAEVLNHHRTFFPYIGLVIATTWMLYLTTQKMSLMGHFSGMNWAVTVLCVIFLGLHGYGTWQRNEVWDSELSLWHDVTIKSPRNGRGLMNYGLAKMGKGDYESAIDAFQKARFTDYGTHPYLLVNLAIAKGALADRHSDDELREEAENHFKTAIRLGSRYPHTHYFYARWLYNQGRGSEALPLLKTTVNLSPAHKGARELIPRVNVSSQKEIHLLEENAEFLQSARAFLNLSLQHYKLEMWEECIQSAGKAISLKPDYAAAYNNICAANIQLKNIELAIIACEKALQLQPDFPLASGNLQWAKSLATPK